MAYSEMTYEVILNRMLNRVTAAYPNIDTREGSIIFNALAPAAIELAIMYTELDNVLKESFVDTASREYILLACEQIGMDTSAFDASAGVHKAQFDQYVELGTRWNCEIYNYTVTGYFGLEDNYHTYLLTCETVGTEPNKVKGDLTPISDAPSDLAYAKLIECVIEGENETPDEDIRAEYKEFITSNGSDGNVSQYERWCTEYDGIGKYKIFPLWDGENTVKVSILSATNGIASQTLIDSFQEYLDPGVSGMGDGEAPIGSFVTVTTASELPIDISASVTMSAGYTDTTVIDTAVTNYFSEIAYQKDVLSYMAIGAAILNVEGVDSIRNLLINGNTDDIQIGIEEIPVLGDVSWE